MNKEEEKDINVTFPEDYPSEELKGAPVVFKIKVNEIKEKINRTLDSEFFEDLAIADVKDEETLRSHIEESIKASKDVDAENKYVDKLIKKVSENTEVDIPEELVDHETHHMVHQFEDQLRMQGMNLDYYYAVTKSNEEALKESMKEEALNRVKYRFVLEEIKSLEKIESTEEEVNSFAEKTAASYGMEKDDFLKAVGGIESIKYEVEMNKVVDFLKENN